MSKEIKAGIKTIGWYVYRFKHSAGPRQLGRTDIIEWCQQNFKGRWAHVPPYTMVYHAFYVEDKHDAMLFKLSWETDKPRFQSPVK